MESCKKDFRNFKKDNGNKINELLNKRIVQFSQMGVDPKIVNSQKDNLKSIRKLIKEGKETVAFSMFFRTFPSCLPYRSER